jgi:Domain of unknown function (DUF5916)/Carbohydrate family 9 binding domain-like
MKCGVILFFIFAQSICSSTAQINSTQAVKINAPIKIDANLDDAAWQNCMAITDFTQSYPTFGMPASFKSSVKIVYDNSAVYIAAYLYDAKQNIRRQLTQRDVVQRQDVDIFAVGFDTYHDKQNAFAFQVTAAGVQADARISQTTNNDNNGVDYTWDAVWESKVAIKEDGWIVEIKIPFSAIRFAKKDVQQWGLNFVRFSRKRNENCAWSPINPAINGEVNQWGIWTGIKNIVPPLRLSFLPYLSTGIKNTPTGTGSITEYLKSGGMDIKYGINESFTLDVSLIPDFAQVQSDNAILNLSPFQIQFDDYRPFFTEGTELFNKAKLFYSRRIGAKPALADDVLDQFGNDSNYKIQKNPGITLLYNATKFSGRTKNNLGIGILNAVTQPMNAQVVKISTGKDSSFITEPMANYNIIVLDKALKNRSSISFTNTNVLRKGNSRNANVTALDISMYDKKNLYNITISPRYSSIWGTQQNYNGFANYISAGKVSGKIQYNISSTIESDTYDPNDLGLLFNNNEVSMAASISYNKFTPTKKFLNYSYAIAIENSYLYKPFVWTDFKAEARAKFLFKNFWDVNFFMETRPFWRNDYFEARSPGRVVKAIPYVFAGAGGSTDSRKKLFARFFAGIGFTNVPNTFYQFYEGGIRYRVNAKLLFNASTEIELDGGNRGYAFIAAGGDSVLMATRNVSKFNNILSVQYGFTPRMNLTCRLRHNWSYVFNTKLHTLNEDGYFNDIAFRDGNNKNANYFNIDMFYTWDFKWGSRLTLAWKNALGGIVALDAYQYNKYGKNAIEVFNSPHSNEVSIKIVYFLDYQKLKKATKN